MRSVTLQFPLAALPLLATPCLRAQTPVPPQGGGSLTLAGTTYAFTPLEALAGKPQGGIKAHILQLRGRFRSSQGETLTFDLQVTSEGKIYRMNLFRKEGDQEVARWAATMKTQVKVLQLEGREGGRVHLLGSGPLSGIVNGQGKQGAWQVDLWFTLQSWPTS